jgi:hypothetical protein
VVHTIDQGVSGGESASTPLRNDGGPGRLSPAQRVASGKAARTKAPLEAHANFRPASGRDPVGLLLDQDTSRVPELVPIRHGRMLVSPFTFYRGAALVMAADLHTTPTPALHTQPRGRPAPALSAVRCRGRERVANR